MSLPDAARQRLEWHRTSTRILVLLIALAFVVPRLALLLMASGMPVSDAKWYFDRAASIVSGNGYAVDGTPTAFWPVGYPGFLALLFFVFPQSPQTGLIANFFLSGITIACSFRIFWELFVSNGLVLFGVCGFSRCLRCHKIWFGQIGGCSAPPTRITHDWRIRRDRLSVWRLL